MHKTRSHASINYSKSKIKGHVKFASQPSAVHPHSVVLHSSFKLTLCQCDELHEVGIIPYVTQSYCTTDSVWCSSDDRRLCATEREWTYCHTRGNSINYALWKKMGRNKHVNCRVKNGSWIGIYIHIHTFTNLYQQKMTTGSACKWSVKLQ